jgi:hypothetical protein
MTQEALKLALEALKDGDWYINQLEMIVYCVDNDEIHFNRAKVQTAITAIKEALAQEQEPSGHFLDFAYSDSIAQVHVYDQFQKGQQFYATPPQRTWVGLTKKEILLVNEKQDESIIAAPDHELIQFARAIEAKFKEKNA